MWYTQKKTKQYRLSTRESVDLGTLGITNMKNARSFKVIHILGVHFRAGEWKRKSCGSVITTIYNGRSRYCVVDKFIKVQNNNCVHVLSLKYILVMCRYNSGVLRSYDGFRFPSMCARLIHLWYVCV